MWMECVSRSLSISGNNVIYNNKFLFFYSIVIIIITNWFSFIFSLNSPFSCTICTYIPHNLTIDSISFLLDKRIQCNDLHSPLYTHYKRPLRGHFCAITPNNDIFHHAYSWLQRRLLLHSAYIDQWNASRTIIRLMKVPPRCMHMRVKRKKERKEE